MMTEAAHAVGLLRLRHLLQRTGTDVDKNDSDPAGDGDQSPLQVIDSGFEEISDLCGDLMEHFVIEMANTFWSACLFGGPGGIELALASVVGFGPVPAALVQFLEHRSSPLRLSPLLLITLFIQTPFDRVEPDPKATIPKRGKKGRKLKKKAQRKLTPLEKESEARREKVDILKVLLKYGARPDACDLMGTTVCHFGAASYATTESMEMVKLCQKAALSAHLFGQFVELHGLENAAFLNGKRGICRGFVVSQNGNPLRTVHLNGFNNKPLDISPDNIKLVDTAIEIGVVRPKLCDKKDRVGGTALGELSRSNCVDVIDFLINDLQADVDVTDRRGKSFMKLVMTSMSPLDSENVSFGPDVHNAVVTRAYW